MKKYQGVFPALYACYDENGEVSSERVKEFTPLSIKYWVNAFTLSEETSPFSS